MLWLLIFLASSLPLILIWLVFLLPLLNVSPPEFCETYSYYYKTRVRLAHLRMKFYLTFFAAFSAFCFNLSSFFFSIISFFLSSFDDDDDDDNEKDVTFEGADEQPDFEFEDEDAIVYGLN
jgi:hypothetical protein